MKYNSYMLQDVCDFIDYRGKTPKKTKSGIPLVTAKIIKNGVIMTPQEFIAEDNYDEWMRRGIPRKGDIVFTTEAPLGEVAEIKTNERLAFAQRVIVMEPKNEYLNNHYLLYALQDKKLKNRIAARASGTTVIGIRSAELKKIIIDLPSIETQEKIADILYSLDEKIALNVAINNNLEQQMQTLFINFISKLSSTEIVMVEDVILTANTGADAIQKALIVDYDTGVRCVRVGDMTNNRSYYDWGYTKVTDEVFKKYQLRKDDIVVTRTASLGLNTIIFDDLRAVYNNGLIRLSVNKEMVLPLFLFRQFQTDNFSNYIARIESETSVRPNMKINYLLKYSFTLPTIAEQSHLIDLLEPMLCCQNNLIKENEKLSKVRDILLPKLMSGKIDISDINF